MKWFVQYDQISLKQRALIDIYVVASKSNFWIRGFAGSGKTLIMTHAMERIKIEKPEAKVAFLTFTHALTDLVNHGFSREGDSEQNLFEVMTHKSFLNKCKADDLFYDYVFLDEVQDVWRKELVGLNDFSDVLVVAGDTEQKIYQYGCTEETIKRVLNPLTEGELTEVFRCTQKLRNVALSVFPESRIHEGTPMKNMRDTDLTICSFDTVKQEVDWVINKL